MLFWVYNLFFVPAAAAFLVVFALSPRRGLLRGFAAELRERLALYPPSLLAKLKNRPVVWFHAASLGEVKALDGLINAVKKDCPGHALILTSSNAVARAQGLKDPRLDAALLAPLDFYPLALRAVRLFKPKALLIAETELWPSLLRAAKRAGARLVLVNARMSPRSFRRYQWARSLMRELLGSLDLVCAQTARDEARYLALGARGPHTLTAGNLKHDRFFDETPDPAPVRAALAAAGWKASDPVFVAGSTHAGEEEAALAAFAAVRAKVPDAKLVLAPRHLERRIEAEAAVKQAGFRFSLWSRPQAGSDVLLLDVVGLLPAVYGAARAAFVGGTLAPRGGHNVLEPVRFSVPVLFGPYLDNVTEVAELLQRSGGGLRVGDAEGLKSELVRVFPDPGLCRELGAAGRKSAESLRGATARTLARLLPLL